MTINMTIYEPIAANGFEWINTVEESDYGVFLSFDGSPQGTKWKPIKVRRMRADDRQDFNLSDFPWLGSDALVFRRKASVSLKCILEQDGEILPLQADDGTELYVYNAATVDALDITRSSIIRFPGSERIMNVKRFYFHMGVVRGKNLFRLPYRSSPTFVSELFVEEYHKARLIGLDFKPLCQE